MPVLRNRERFPWPQGTGRMPAGLVCTLAVIAASIAAPAGCGRGVDLDASRRFQDAQEAFERAKKSDDFLIAAGLYQQILDRGIVSGAVFYNQGNAFMRAGRRGEAIAAYRQAKRYRPRDPYLDANLQYALGSQAIAPQRRPAVDTLLFWQDWISYPGVFRLTAALGGLTFAVAAAWLVVRRPLLAWFAKAAAAVTLAAALSAAYDWYRYEAVTYGVVTAHETVARKGNAESYEPAFTEPLREGAEFHMLDRRGGWLLVRMPGGQEGWVGQNEVVVY